MFVLTIPSTTVTTPLQDHRLKELCSPENRDSLIQTLSLLSKIHKRKIHNLSLRRVDWMVTNYCKTLDVCRLQNTQRWSGDTPITRIHDIYIEWRRNFKRIVFDPFCRTGGLFFSDGDEKIPTTIAQLNFFFFLVEMNFVDFMIKNIHKIATHQQETLKTRSSSKGNNKKRSLLTNSISEKVSMCFSNCNMSLQM